jgi:hypothetical protein
MHGTNSQANLSPCVRLFIELLFKEVGEVDSSECSPSVSCRTRRDDIAPTVRKAFDTPGPCSSECTWTSQATSSSSKTSTKEPSCNCSNG